MEGSSSSSLSSLRSRLHELHRLRTESQSMNRAAVAEERHRASEPRNADARRRRAAKELEESETRERLDREGRDYWREKWRTTQADEAEAMDRRRRSKEARRDEGFSTFEAATARKHGRLVANIKPDMHEYERQRSRVGDELFYASAGSVVQDLRADRPEAVDRMAEDVERQVAKRDKFSRRRRHDVDADIDYINERNMNFNRKLERFYGEYTKDIQDNLERGTAV